MAPMRAIPTTQLAALTTKTSRILIRRRMRPRLKPTPAAVRAGTPISTPRHPDDRSNRVSRWVGIAVRNTPKMIANVKVPTTNVVTITGDRSAVPIPES